MQTFTGTQYLEIDIANCFGLDRLDWDDRLHWFANNEPDLESLDHLAKSPILFRKAVRAMRLVQHGKPTNHIMGLDATASGLQIMSALSGCPTTGMAVNLVDMGYRADVYSTVSTEMNQVQEVSVDRDIVKKPVMTTFYGSRAQPREVFGKGTALIAFYKALKEKLPGAYELMGKLQKYWSPTALYHQWTLPDGHVARVPVVKTLEKNLEIDEYDHMRFKYRAQIVTPKLKSRSLAANVVHSLDGWVVRQMVHAAHQQGFWMAPIHDCFFASPNHMNEVRANYVQILQWIADNPQVPKILSEIAGHKVNYKQKTTDLSSYIAQTNYALS